MCSTANPCICTRSIVNDSSCLTVPLIAGYSTMKVPIEVLTAASDAVTSVPSRLRFFEVPRSLEVLSTVSELSSGRSNKSSFPIPNSGDTVTRFTRFWSHCKVFRRMLVNCCALSCRATLVSGVRMASSWSSTHDLGLRCGLP